MKNWIVGSLLVAMAFGCASKKKEDQDVNPGAAVTDAPIGYDSMGSDSGKIAGLGTVYFDYDKSNLTRESEMQLKQNAQWLKDNAGANLQIEGHCDERGSIEYNLALGERRAKAVRAYLVKLGVAGSRLSVVSYGKERPLSMGDSEASHAKNRRANFVPLK